MTLRILEACDLASLIGDTGKSIALKPNLVTTTPPEEGATTHPEILAGVIEYLQAHGFRDITVMESAWVGARTEDVFQICYHNRVCEKYGVPFLDMKKDTYTTYDAAGMDIAVCDRAMAVDFMINLPVLKGHAQTKVTCALKNNKGVIPDFEKRRFHTLGLHKPIAHLNTVCKNDFILVDNICGDLDFEEGGNPVVMDRILAFRDPVLCDAFVCEAMGYALADVPYVGLAERLGVGSADVAAARRIYVNEPGGAVPAPTPDVSASLYCAGHSAGPDAHIASRNGAHDAPVPAPWRTSRSSEIMQAPEPAPSRRVARLAAHTIEDQACSACYGALIHALSRMERAGTLSALKETVCVGQGFQGKSGPCGVGRCTAQFARSLPGCPPDAGAIRRFLEAM